MRRRIALRKLRETDQPA